jgi:hypothetical protein
MHEFFNPWRPKAGCVTLVMACVFTAGLIRSQEDLDILYLNYGSHNYKISSGKGQLHFGRTPYIEDAPAFDWRFGVGLKHINRLDGYYWFETWTRVPAEWRYDWAGFHISDGITFTGYRLIFCCVPYWSIVTPLTTLSAYLLLRKPRAPVTKKSPAPVSTAGA